MIKIYTGKFVVLKVCFFNQQSSISVPIRLKKKKNPITSIAVSKKKICSPIVGSYVFVFSFHRCPCKIIARRRKRDRICKTASRVYEFRLTEIFFFFSFQNQKDYI